MAGRLAYVETSALVKLVLDEPQAGALRSELEKWDDRVASRLVRSEAIRACARYGRPYARRADEMTRSLSLFPISDELLEAAATIKPVELRTLDAIHLATALRLQADLGAMFVYDARLAAAARDAGLAVLSPGT